MNLIISDNSCRSANRYHREVSITGPGAELVLAIELNTSIMVHNDGCHVYLHTSTFLATALSSLTNTQHSAATVHTHHDDYQVVGLRELL